MMPWAPGERFAGHRYVSDVLETLLDAGEIRYALRAYCTQLLDDVPDPLHTQLQPVAAYVGGKCMGYPAVWFLERLLAPEGISVASILERCGTALCVSLTTSIVDDLSDGDEAIDSAYLAYLYVLIAKIAFDVPQIERQNSRARDLLYRALDACLNPHAKITSASVVRRGDRIGGFYRMIAADTLVELWPEDRAAIAIEAIGEFGEVCAHIDDWMDAERDLERGVMGNAVLLLLAQQLGRAPSVHDLFEHRAELLTTLTAVLTSKLTALRVPISLDDILAKLSATLAAITPAAASPTIPPRVHARAVCI